jgi:hypothetical protein|uniref:Orf92 n=1 Tax=Ochromonas danica TaxID=2986 RepID=Q9G912_OCHDN|nr:orf92 [Ochromonas danica]AAG18393.1 orf92 [Ochromonas danica]
MFHLIITEIARLKLNQILKISFFTASILTVIIYIIFYEKFDFMGLLKEPNFEILEIRHKRFAINIFHIVFTGMFVLLVLMKHAAIRFLNKNH